MARLAARPLTPGKARRLAAEAITDQGPEALVDDVAQVVSELVANAVRHTEAPVELTVDAHDDVIRVRLAGGWSAGVPVGAGSMVWAAELRGPDTG